MNRNPSAAVQNTKSSRPKHLGLILLTFVLATTSAVGFAQSRKSKVPVIRRLLGVNHQAFSGVVRSLDSKRKILNVQRAEARDIEIFPVKKSTHVTNVSGKILGLKALRPGTDVMIYYTERNGERKISQIMVLGGKPSGGKKENHPKS